MAKKGPNLDFDFSNIDDEVDKMSKLQAIEVKERLDTSIAISSGSLAMDVAILGGGYYPGRGYDLVGVESSGKCITGDSLVPTPHGIYPIRELVGDDVNGLKEKYIELYTFEGPAHTSHVYSQMAHTIKITLENGLSLAGTYDHPVLTSVEDRWEWVKLRSLRIGDEVHCVCGPDYFSKNQHPLPSNCVRPLYTTYMTEGLARLLVTSKFEDISIKDKLNEILPSKNGVPYEILKSPRNVFLEYIRSYLAYSDWGEIRASTNVSKELLRQLQILLLYAGVMSQYDDESGSLTLTHNPVLCTGEVECQGYLNDYDDDAKRFLVSNDINSKELIVGNYHAKFKVKKIEDGGYHRVYDLTVPDKHQFIANGMIVHNTTTGTAALGEALHSIPNYTVGYYFDYEGSLDKTWFMNIAGMSKESPEKVFGQRDEETGGWTIRPRIRLYKPNFGEKGLLHIIKQLNSKPDKALYMDEWWYTWTPVDAKVKKATGGLTAKDIEDMLKAMGIQYDKKFLKLTGLYGVKVPNNYGGTEGIYFIDSYASMTPRQTAEDDSAAMAQQGRMFGKYINTIKSLISAKGYTVIGVNQNRMNPNARFGNPNYNPGGEALKHFCDLRNEFNAISNQNGTGAVEVDNNGRDEYKWFSVYNRKNKITIPYGHLKGRYWTKRDGRTGCGIDPVQDLINYLQLTGQLDVRRKGFQITLKDNSKPAGKLNEMLFKYEDLKSMIINKEVDTGEKTISFDLRLHCQKQIRKGIGMNLYYDNQGKEGEVTEDAD